MAHGGGDAFGDLKWLIFFLIILWGVWYFTGQSANPSANDPFIKPPAPLDTGETYGPGEY